MINRKYHTKRSKVNPNRELSSLRRIQWLIKTLKQKKLQFMMKEITVLIQIVTNQIITTKKSKRKIKMINIRRTIDLSGQH